MDPSINEEHRHREVYFVSSALQLRMSSIPAASHVLLRIAGVEGFVFSGYCLDAGIEFYWTSRLARLPARKTEMINRSET
jgi:hypothetical protein